MRPTRLFLPERVEKDRSPSVAGGESVGRERGEDRGEERDLHAGMV